MATISNKISGKSGNNLYTCDLCDYKCSKKYNWNKHLLTAKHKSATFSNILSTHNFETENNHNATKIISRSLDNKEKAAKKGCQIKQNYNVKELETNILDTEYDNKTKSGKKWQKVAKSSKSDDQHFVCNNCNKIYKDRSGLWRHNKKCFVENELDKDELIIMLIKQNAEMIKNQQDITMEIVKNGTTNNTTHTNSHNKVFNLNLFLNETCKDAMNISDFVSSINVELNDLEITGKSGYVEGITNIFLKNLNNIEKHMRPLHCSDLKREVLYIKDNNEWTKETDSKPILTKAIKSIANENIKKIKNWRDKYPDCVEYESNKNNFYLKIVSNSMNGSTKEESDKNINKIISNIAKEVVINKQI